MDHDSGRTYGTPHESMDTEPPYHSYYPHHLSPQSGHQLHLLLDAAVRNHTVGSPDMSVFDEIILLADYIEFGRSYEGCVALRKKVFDELEGCEGADECVAVLHSAVAESLDNNIKEFTSRGKPFHSRTKLTRDAILAKIER